MHLPSVMKKRARVCRCGEIQPWLKTIPSKVHHGGGRTICMKFSGELKSGASSLIRRRCLFVFLTLTTMVVADDRSKAPLFQSADARYKADFVLILAHEDDDTAFSGFLARAVSDQHRKGAVIFITSGEAGDDAAGRESGKALGAVREIEARQALASFGITNVWFLHGPNGPNTQDVLHVLEYWDHGSILGQIVRLLRLTRPEVVLSMFPGVVAGENHPDHQAAGVLATEAFDLAGDPVAFPEQLGISAENDPSGHNPEGLQPWQPEKLYFWSDAFDSGASQWIDPPPASPFRKNFLEGAGPVYPNKDVSPSQHISYAEIAARHASFYESQDGSSARAALAARKFKDFEPPERYVFGKSLVQANVTGDVFEGIVPFPIPFRPQQYSPSALPKNVGLEFGGAWNFYRDFWAAHGVDSLRDLLPVPEVSLRMGKQLNVPLILHNNTDTLQDVSLETVLPEGWTNRTHYSIYPVMPGDSYPLSLDLMTPVSGKTAWQEIEVSATTKGQQIGKLTLRVCLRSPTPQ